MIQKPNGILVKWALGLLAAGILSLGGWGGKTLITDGQRITGLEAVHSELRGQLGRIERKVDRLIERGR